MRQRPPGKWWKTTDRQWNPVFYKKQDEVCQKLAEWICWVQEFSSRPRLLKFVTMRSKQVQYITINLEYLRGSSSGTATNARKAFESLTDRYEPTWSNHKTN